MVEIGEGELVRRRDHVAFVDAKTGEIRKNQPQHRGQQHNPDCIHARCMTWRRDLRKGAGRGQEPLNQL